MAVQFSYQYCQLISILPTTDESMKDHNSFGYYYYWISLSASVVHRLGSTYKSMTCQLWSTFPLMMKFTSVCKIECHRGLIELLWSWSQMSHKTCCLRRSLIFPASFRHMCCYLCLIHANVLSTGTRTRCTQDSILSILVMKKEANFIATEHWHSRLTQHSENIKRRSFLHFWFC